VRAIVRDHPPLASVAALICSFSVLPRFVDRFLEWKANDEQGRHLGHVASEGGSFYCCCELDNYGVVFEGRDGGWHSLAQYAVDETSCSGYGLFLVNVMADEWKAPRAGDLASGGAARALGGADFWSTYWVRRCTSGQALQHHGACTQGRAQ
jgi:hypothetical protein